MALLLHLCEAAVSHRWQRLFTRMIGPVHLGDGTDGALFLHGYCRKYTKITYPIWQPASDKLASTRKNEKNTLWGYRKFCHCMSLYISIMRWRNKNIAVRKQKITVRKVLSDYNLTTKMDMPGRQTFWEPGICNDIMCHAKEAVCIFYFRFSSVWCNRLKNKLLA